MMSDEKCQKSRLKGDHGTMKEQQILDQTSKSLIKIVLKIVYFVINWFLD